MADWSRREVVTTTVEYVVEARPPYGACWSQVQQALNKAVEEANEADGRAKYAEPADDRIWVRPTDEEVIITFEMREETSY